MAHGLLGRAMTPPWEVLGLSIAHLRGPLVLVPKQPAELKEGPYKTSESFFKPPAGSLRAGVVSFSLLVKGPWSTNRTLSGLGWALSGQERILSGPGWVLGPGMDLEWFNQLNQAWVGPSQAWKGPCWVWHGPSCLCWALSVLSLEPGVKHGRRHRRAVGAACPHWDEAVWCEMDYFRPGMHWPSHAWLQGFLCSPMSQWRIYGGGGRGTLWRVLLWMNGRRPDPLDALWDWNPSPNLVKRAHWQLTYYCKRRRRSSPESIAQHDFRTLHTQRVGELPDDCVQYIHSEYKSRTERTCLCVATRSSPTLWWQRRSRGLVPLTTDSSLCSCSNNAAWIVRSPRRCVTPTPSHRLRCWLLWTRHRPAASSQCSALLRQCHLPGGQRHLLHLTTTETADIARPTN